MKQRTLFPRLGRTLVLLLLLGLSLGLGASSCSRKSEQRATSRAKAPRPNRRSESSAIKNVARRYDDFQKSAKSPTAATTPRKPSRVPAPTKPAPTTVEERISAQVVSKELQGLSKDILVQAVAHDPERPAPRRAVTIYARIRSGVALNSATLHYRTGRGEATAPLELESLQPATTTDDGKPPTRSYTARLRGFPAGSLVKYWITVRDGSGGEGRFPDADSPTRTLGLFVEDPSTESKLPLYHLFLNHSALSTLKSNPFSDTYQRGDFVHDGKVYCDVGLRYRGQTSRRYPKRQWKIKFNPDHHFISPTPSRMELSTINLKSAYVDKIFMREMLGFELFRELGEPYCETEFIRTYLNGKLLGLYLQVENAGSTYLKRNGLDENGWLWKAYSEGHGEGQSRERGSRFFGASQESRLERSTHYGGIHRFELKAGDPATANTVLDRFLRNINRLKGEELERYLRENVDVDSMINYLVACQLIHNADHVMKNYLIYADSNGKFRYLPWDLDLTHGRNYECGPGILNNTIRYDLWDSEFGDDALLYGTLVHPKCDGFWNALINAFLGRAKAFRPLYYKRLAECLGRYYHPDVLVPKAERIRDRIREDARLDRRRWGSYGGEKDFDRRFRRFIDWIPKRYDHLRRKLEGLGYRVGR